jgi:hypothetical protein
MAAKTGITDDIELRVLLERIIRAQLDIIDLRLVELQDSSLIEREAKVLVDLRALSKAAQGLLRNVEQGECQPDQAVAM